MLLTLSPSLSLANLMMLPVASSTARPSVEAVLEHADIFLAAAEGLGVEPGEAWVIEDSPAGIRAAIAGSFTPVMVPDLVQPDDELRASVPVFGSLLDVKAELEKLAN